MEGGPESLTTCGTASLACVVQTSGTVLNKVEDQNKHLRLSLLLITTCAMCTHVHKHRHTNDSIQFSARAFACAVDKSLMMSTEKLNSFFLK